MMRLKTFEHFHDDDSSKGELKNYMFFQNLKTIKEDAEKMLSRDAHEVDELLSHHDWASDHIATSKDDIQEVCDFICNSIEKPQMLGESYSENIKVILDSLKNASEEQIEKISGMISKKLTWGNIVELAEVLHLENKIHK